jgi:hypothetical protein
MAGVHSNADVQLASCEAFVHTLLVSAFVCFTPTGKCENDAVLAKEVSSPWL